MGKTEFYGVVGGKSSGVFKTWKACRAQIEGYPNAKHAIFTDKEDADAWVTKSLTGPSLPVPIHFMKLGWKIPFKKLSGWNDDDAKIETSTSFGIERVITSEVEKQDKSENKRTADDDGNKRRKRIKKMEKDEKEEKKVSVKEKVWPVYVKGWCEGKEESKTAGFGVWWHPIGVKNASERIKGIQSKYRAELQAAIKAINQAKHIGLQSIEIHTKSQYLINSVTNRLSKWRRSGWVVNGQPIKYKDDYKDFCKAMDGIEIEWVCDVDSEGGTLGTEGVDELARDGCKKDLEPEPQMKEENVGRNLKPDEENWDGDHVTKTQEISGENWDGDCMTKTQENSGGIENWDGHCVKAQENSEGIENWDGYCVKAQENSEGIENWDGYCVKAQENSKGIQNWDGYCVKAQENSKEIENWDGYCVKAQENSKGIENWDGYCVKAQENSKGIQNWDGYCVQAQENSKGIENWDGYCVHAQENSEGIENWDGDCVSKIQKNSGGIENLVGDCVKVRENSAVTENWDEDSQAQKDVEINNETVGFGDSDIVNPQIENPKSAMDSIDPIPWKNRNNDNEASWNWKREDKSKQQKIWVPRKQSRDWDRPESDDFQKTEDAPSNFSGWVPRKRFENRGRGDNRRGRNSGGWGSWSCQNEKNSEDENDSAVEGFGKWNPRNRDEGKWDPRNRDEEKWDPRNRDEGKWDPRNRDEGKWRCSGDDVDGGNERGGKWNPRGRGRGRGGRNFGGRRGFGNWERKNNCNRWENNVKEPGQCNRNEGTTSGENWEPENWDLELDCK